MIVTMQNLYVNHLSSLPGSAITSVKIEGVLHEFSTIPNVVEDVPEIVINLKNVRLKLDKNEEKTLRIDVREPGEVKAGDIITDGTVEILNPDLHIATVSEGGTLKMELTADMGRGYNNAEKNKKHGALHFRAGFVFGVCGAEFGVCV